MKIKQCHCLFPLTPESFFPLPSLKDCSLTALTLCFSIQSYDPLLQGELRASLRTLGAYQAEAGRY